MTPERETSPPTASAAPDLVIAGNLLVDDIVYADGRALMEEPGGAVLYGSLAASLWPIRVGVVAPRGGDYPAWALETLASRGVDLAGIRPLAGPGLRTWLLYEPNGRRVVHRLGGASHAEASPNIGDFPPGWDRARRIHLAPIPFTLQQGLAEAILERDPGARVSIDPHEPIRDDTLPAWNRLIPRLASLFASEDELRLDGARESLGAAMLRLRPGRADWHHVARLGDRGGFVFCDSHPHGLRWEPRAERVVEVTGAGDAFAAGFLAGLLLGDALPAACRRGVVSASFALEDRGVHGLVAASPARAAERLAAWSTSNEESNA